jgi:hypothetical protein
LFGVSPLRKRREKELGDSMVLTGRQADVDIGTERAGDFGLQIVPRRGAGNPPDHLADQVAKRVDVIPVSGAR